MTVYPTYCHHCGGLEDPWEYTGNSGKKCQCAKLAFVSGDSTMTNLDDALQEVEPILTQKKKKKKRLSRMERVSLYGGR